jgi:putative membrane protein
MAAADWSAVGGQAAQGAWHLLGLAGPAICALLLFFLVARAISRQKRYRVAQAFTEQDRRAVREAIAAAERKTVGEILPVVVERSDPHPAAQWFAALSFVLVGSTLLIVFLPWKHPVWVLAEQVAFGFVGYGLARWLPDLKRSFVFENRASAVAEEQAFQEFYGNGLHKTEGATGVLLFVSLFERRVVVLADEGIDSKVDAEFWEGVDELVLDGVRRGSLREGLVQGIQRVGDLLADQFPWTKGNRNEVPDRVIVRVE